MNATAISQQQQQQQHYLICLQQPWRLSNYSPIHQHNLDMQIHTQLLFSEQVWFEAVGSSDASHIPAHLVEEAVRFGHTVQLVFVLLQQIDVTLLRDKLQQLWRKEKNVYSTCN